MPIPETAVPSPVPAEPLEPQWCVVSLTVRVVSGTVPPLPPRVEAFRCAHWCQAVEHFSRVLGVAKEDVEIARVS